MKQHVVIVAVGRSGGSMLARMFDGHPAVASYPFEPRFGEVLPSLHWKISEEFRRPLEGSLSEALDKNGRLQRFNSKVQGLSPSKHAQISYDYAAFERNLKRQLPKDASPALFRDMVSEAFFTCHALYRDRWDSIKTVVWHSANSQYWDGDYLADGTTKLIYVLRHPLDVLPSLMTLKSEKRSINPEFEVLSWVDCALRAQERCTRVPDRAVAVRYEDLVRFPEVTMRRLADFAQIKEHPALFAPTIYGEAWAGASSFGKVHGVSTGSIGRFASTLTSETIDQLWALCGRVAEEWGYRLTAPHASEGACSAPPACPGADLWPNLARDFYLAYCRAYRRQAPEQSQSSGYGAKVRRHLSGAARRLGFVRISESGR